MERCPRIESAEPSVLRGRRSCTWSSASWPHWASGSSAPLATPFCRQRLRVATSHRGRRGHQQERDQPGDRSRSSWPSATSCCSRGSDWSRFGCSPRPDVLRPRLTMRPGVRSAGGYPPLEMPKRAQRRGVGRGVGDRGGCANEEKVYRTTSKRRCVAPGISMTRCDRKCAQHFRAP
jgi:hypothetical protein